MPQNNSFFTEDIESLRSEKETLLLEDANRRGELDKLDELEAFLDELPLLYSFL